MPKVSVIVPNYNHQFFLEKRLSSIVNQTFQDFELIILDDASTDQSLEFINEFSKSYKGDLRVVPNKTNSGSPFVQWDKGVKLAKADLIWIAESDDLADEKFLEQLVPYFDGLENLGLVCCKSNAINSEGMEISPLHPMFTGYEERLFPSGKGIQMYNGKNFIEDILVYKCVIPNVSGVVFKKETYLKAGGLNLSLRRAGDYDLYLRMLPGYKVVFLNEILNSTRYHDHKLTAKNNEQSFSELKTILTPIFKELKIGSEKRLEIMSFYFTVYKYDIFLNPSFTFTQKLSIFKGLADMSGKLYLKFFKFLWQRVKIESSKRLKG